MLLDRSLILIHEFDCLDNLRHDDFRLHALWFWFEFTEQCSNVVRAVLNSFRELVDSVFHVGEALETSAHIVLSVTISAFAKKIPQNVRRLACLQYTKSRHLFDISVLQIRVRDAEQVVHLMEPLGQR